MESKGTVIWIDPHMEWRSPTMKNMLAALPHLLDMGWNMEFLCFRSDPVDPRVKIRKLPCPLPLGPLDCWWFRILLHWDNLVSTYPENALLHDTGVLHPSATLHSIHFDNSSWLKFQVHLSPKSIKDYLRLFLTATSAAWEKFAYRMAKHCYFLPVSNSMADLLRPKVHATAQMEVLPNVLDATRFHVGVRNRWRDEVRENLGIAHDTKVFVFASTGHYLRKGFWEAVKALNASREVGFRQIHFLVVGASPKAITELQPRLDKEYAGWEQWLSWIAPTTEIEKYYAAGDAFLFPSRYESFALVAIEASACGLPLLITDYPGAEMYFKDGVNGRLLSWDAEEMALQIQDFLKDGSASFQCGPIASTNALEYAMTLDRVYTKALHGAN